MTEVDRRKKDRDRVIGDILWSYATNPPSPSFEGTLVDMSKSGIGMFSTMSVREGSVLRIEAKGLWKGVKYATVMWCEDGTEVYRSGLLFTSSLTS